MDKIDQLADADGKYIININELRDFDWDKKIYFKSEQMYSALLYRSKLKMVVVVI